MTFWASWTNPTRISDWLIGRVARFPARVQTKLLAAFLTIAGLLIVLGAVGLQVLNGFNGRTEDLIKLQRKIAAYHQVQHDTTNQLYSISTALLLQDDYMLEAALRQLNQFGYDLDRMEFVAQDEAEILAEVRKDYEHFTVSVTEAVEMIRGDRTVEARQVQRSQIVPLADRLERQTNQLVNIAEADMVAAIDATSRTYQASRIIVIAFALGSLALALGLGYVISLSLLKPVREIEVRLRRIAAGEFGQRVEVANRDELGVLAGNVNQTSEKLGKLYDEIETQRRDLSESLQQQTATAEVLKAISRSAFDLQTVLKTLVESVAKLCAVNYGGIFLRDGEQLRGCATIAERPESAWDLNHPLVIDRRSISGRVMLSGRVEVIPDILADPEYDITIVRPITDSRALMGVPLFRDGKVDGVFFLGRPKPGSFTQRQIDLVLTFADQAVIAIENVRLFEEVQARNSDLSEALEQQTATSAILSVIAASPTDIQPVMKTVAENVAKLCDVYDVSIALRSADGKWLETAVHYGPVPLQASRFPVGRDWPAGRAFVDGKSVQVPDFALAAEEFPFGSEMAAQAGFRSALAVPLLREGIPIGVIGMRRFEVKSFTEKQIKLLTTFADQAVIAIENVRLFKEVEARTEDLSESLRQQTATAEVLKSISSSAFDLDAVLHTLLISATELCRALNGYIFLRDGDVYRPAQLVGITPFLHKDLLNNPIRAGRDSVTGRVALTGSVVQIADVLEDAEYTLAPGQKVGGYRTILGVPLMRNGAVTGVFTLGRPEVQPFNQREIELVKTFADQAVIAIENVRLFEEVQARTRQLQESLDYQTATSSVLNVISRSPTELQPVLDVIVETAVRLCEADGGTIARKHGEQFIRCGVYGLSPEFSALMRRSPVEMTRASISGRTLVDGKVVHILDAEADPEYTWAEALDLERIRSGLGVPLLRDGIPIGVIALVRRTVRPFTDKQIELVTTFADQAVIAIENARLFEEVQLRTRDLQESLEYQTATSDILNVISRSPTDIQPVLDVVAQNASRICQANDALIFRIHGDELRLVASYGPLPAATIMKDRGLPIVRGLTTGRAVLDRQTIHVADLAAELDTEYPDARPYQQEVGHRTVLATPLLRDGIPLGVIHIRRMEVKPFSTKQIALLETFADQAVIAIENVRLFEEVQARTRELARSVGELRALGEVSQAVNSTLDLKTVLETIVAKAVQLSGTDTGAIYVYDRSTEIFRLRATYGMSEELIAAITRQTVSLHDAGIGEAARNRAPLQIPDLSRDASSPLHRIVLDAGYRSVLIVPLLRPNKITGALVVRRKAPADFAESTVQLMQTFAAQSVLAIQNARLFREIEEKGHQLEVASRHKSQFLANMSHELRTPLNSVLGFSEMLADGLYGQLPEKAVNTLGRIQANGKHLLGLINDVLDLSKIEAGQLQLTIDDYSPGQIVKAAAAAAEPMARAKNLALNLTITETMPMGRGDERRLTQVLINLVGNAVKFTDHGSVEIAAQATNGSFEFIVRDTGPGIAPEFQSRIFEEFQQVDDSSTRKKGGTGLGLAITKRIVEMHGGTIGVKSAIGVGSEFMVTIPVTASQRTEAA